MHIPFKNIGTVWISRKGLPKAVVLKTVKLKKEKGIYFA